MLGSMVFFPSRENEFEEFLGDKIGRYSSFIGKGLLREKVILRFLVWGSLTKVGNTEDLGGVDWKLRICGKL